MKRFALLLIAIITFQSHAQLWSQDQKIVASDRASNDYFGESVAIDGDMAIVGTSRTNGTINSSFVGSAYIFEKDSNDVWQEIQILNASDEKQNDNFGNAVAIQGNYAFVAAIKEGSSIDNFNGAVYVFERGMNGIWNEIQKITPSDRLIYQRFGNSIEIEGDTLVVGSFQSINNGGSVLIFEKDTNGIWVETQILTSSDTQNDDQFGSSVFIDGDTLLIGASREDQQLSDNAGAAYIFNKDVNGIWQEQQKLTATTRITNALFGSSVSIDGNYLVVGARGESDFSNNDFEFGAAFVFKKDTNGIWLEQQRLLASDMINGDHFGSVVTISNDNIVIGAPDKTVFVNNVTFYTYSGSAYLFKRNTADVWNEEEIIIPSPRFSDAYFGYTISLNGNQLLIGALNEDRNETNSNFLQDAGAAYFFTDTSSLSISENIYNNKQILYPNPSNNFIKITNSNTKENYKIYNTLGLLSKEGQLNDRINIQNLNPGFYFLKIENKSPIRFIKK